MKKALNAIYALKADKRTSDKVPVFLKEIHEDLNESYPSMVVYPQILDYSIIIHQITRRFESETFWLWNLLY